MCTELAILKKNKLTSKINNTQFMIPIVPHNKLLSKIINRQFMILIVPNYFKN